MPKCAIKDCFNLTQYKGTRQIYCSKHLARVRRHGYPELKKNAYQDLEKLPHKIVDIFIIGNCKKMTDAEITQKLQEKGFNEATQWTVKYRRRKLGVKKYMAGDILKHKAWVREQAIKAHGNECELCGYNLTLDAHHIVPKKFNGPSETENLMVLCPNCHALITRNIFTLESRSDLKKIRKEINKLLNPSIES